MVAFTFMVEPNTVSGVNLVAANYRQIFFRVLADSAVPFNQPMYADVYFDSVYYKTLTSYTINTDALFGFSIFDFDIQDAAQEFIKTQVPSILISTIQRADPTFGIGTAYCVVKFRGSTISVDGILTPEGPIPVQGTATTAPVPGGGMPCDQFVISNASILPSWKTIYDNSSVASGAVTSYENYLQRNKITGLSLIADTRIYPLSNLPPNPLLTPNLSICNNQWKVYSGGFPIHVLQFGTSGILDRLNRNCSAYMIYGTNGVMANIIQITASALITTEATYYLPVGLADLIPLIAYVVASDLVLNPRFNNYYRVAMFDDDAGVWCFFSPLYKVCTIAVGTRNIWFQNLFGHFENITFVRNESVTSVQSSEQFIPYTQEFNQANVSPNTLTLGRQRFNVRLTDVATLTGVFNEEIMEWIKEAVSNSYAYQQTSDSPSGFKAVDIIDGSFDIKKLPTKAGIRYTVSMKIRPAIDTSQLRN